MVSVFDVDYLESGETIEFLTDGRCIYSYRGRNFRIFKSREEVYKFLFERDFSLVVAEFDNEQQLEAYLITGDTLFARAAALWQKYKDIDKVALQLCDEGYIKSPSELSELTLEETARVLGVSVQRAQQIEERATKKLQHMLQFL